MNNKIIAMIASLDTKSRETAYAKAYIEGKGYSCIVIDSSTRGLANAGADISPIEILRRAGYPEDSFLNKSKADCIDIMSKALGIALRQIYAEGLFSVVISIGGGQNARMAASAMKMLPFGVPKIVASSLACGKRTMEQYVGDKDIMVMHTVADISGINSITESVIKTVCNAAIGLAENNEPCKSVSKIRVAASMLGITSRGVEGAMKLLPDAQFEKTCFHANGVGGRCMESLIKEGKFDVVADLTLHEITCEVLGGYCQGANGRLLAALERKLPMVVAPGALDMLDFFIDEEGKGLPPDIGKRRKVFHNSSIAHTKIFKEEAEKVVALVCERLNTSEAPVTVILPRNGFCEASAKGGPMYDAEVDELMISMFRKKLKPEIAIIEVDGNINDEPCQKAISDAVMMLVQNQRR